MCTPLRPPHSRAADPGSDGDGGVLGSPAVGSAGGSGLDAMSHCYPPEVLQEYLAPGATHKTHRRCRGGLLALLRALEAHAGHASPGDEHRAGSSDDAWVPELYPAPGHGNPVARFQPRACAPTHVGTEVPPSLGGGAAHGGFGSSSGSRGAPTALVPPISTSYLPVGLPTAGVDLSPHGGSALALGIAMFEDGGDGDGAAGDGLSLSMRGDPFDMTSLSLEAMASGMGGLDLLPGSSDFMAAYLAGFGTPLLSGGGASEPRAAAGADTAQAQPHVMRGPAATAPLPPPLPLPAPLQPPQVAGPRPVGGVEGLWHSTAAPVVGQRATFPAAAAAAGGGDDGDDGSSCGGLLGSRPAPCVVADLPCVEGAGAGPHPLPAPPEAGVGREAAVGSLGGRGRAASGDSGGDHGVSGFVAEGGGGGGNGAGGSKLRARTHREHKPTVAVRAHASYFAPLPLPDPRWVPVPLGSVDGEGFGGGSGGASGSGGGDRSGAGGSSGSRASSSAAAAASCPSSTSLPIAFDFSLDEAAPEDPCFAPAASAYAAPGSTSGSTSGSISGGGGTAGDGGVCCLCRQPCPPVTIKLMKHLSDAKLAFDVCAAEFGTCVGLACPPAAADGSHRVCRAAFQKQFCVPTAALGPHLHCCWDLPSVRRLFEDHDALVCTQCCDALYDVLSALERCVGGVQKPLPPPHPCLCPCPCPAPSPLCAPHVQVEGPRASSTAHTRRARHLRTPARPSAGPSLLLFAPEWLRLRMAVPQTAHPHQNHCHPRCMYAFRWGWGWVCV